jgi:PAS domain S-box-containing protein
MADDASNACPMDPGDKCLGGRSGKRSDTRLACGDGLRNGVGSVGSDSCREPAGDHREEECRTEQRFGALMEFLPDPIVVFYMDGTVSYLNPAFENIFGWRLKECEGKRLAFVPQSERTHTRVGMKQLFAQQVLHGFETRRMTQDGRILDVVIDGAIFCDAQCAPAGQIITLRDITARKRAERTNQALFRIARALYRFPRLDRMLAYITRQVRELIGVGGAAVILIDEQKQEFYIPVATYEDGETGSKMKEIRFSMDKGVAGYVYRTGQALIVPDTTRNPYFYDKVNALSQYQHRNMLDVPLRIKDRMIGVLNAVNKKEGAFDQTDVDLLSAVANLVALPIENARINEALQQAYENVNGLSRAKEQVIHHLSHELKTPLSVLSASLALVEKHLLPSPDEALERILARARRNLKRLLDMQYEIGDMLREQDYRAHGMLSFLFDACRDMLVTLAEAHPEGARVAAAIQQTIDREFGDRDLPCTRIALDRVVARHLEVLKPRFAHRRLRLETRLEPVAPVLIPEEVMKKIVEGLVKNAIENTPDDGRVTVVVRRGETGPVFEVRDTGTGIAPEKQQLIFNHYFATGDTRDYASRSPYDFNAGGKGFELLRITIFSERYQFTTKMISRRCPHIPSAGGHCPGGIDRCPDCRGPADCDASGGTTLQIRFVPADRAKPECRLADPRGSQPTFFTREL